MLCPSCATPRSVARVVPRAGYKWALLTCASKHCKKSCKVNLWDCECGKHWRVCPKHAKWDHFASLLRANPVPASLKLDHSASELALPPSKVRKKSAPAPRQKRAQPSSSLTTTNLVQHSLAKVPRLAARFAHLLNRSESSSVVDVQSAGSVLSTGLNVESSSGTTSGLGQVCGDGAPTPSSPRCRKRVISPHTRPPDAKRWKFIIPRNR
jgi:hypothetical protein